MSAAAVPGPASAGGSIGAAGSINARALFVWSLSALTIAVATDNPVYRVLVILVSLDVLQARLAPGRRVRPVLVAGSIAALFALVISAASSHTGADVLFRLPDAIPLFGGAITLESVVYGCAIGLGLFAALLAVAPLSLVLEAHDVVDAMPRALERTGIAVAASLNLVGGVGRTFTAVRDAQRMRGWRPRGILGWREVLVPVVLSSIEDAVLVAESMEARGFGAGRRTSYGGTTWTRTDVLVALAAVAGAAIVLGLEVAGLAGDWYPYPTVEMPAVSLPVVIGCLLLAAPAILPSPSDGGRR